MDSRYGDIETHLAANCTKVLVWHTMTMANVRFKPITNKAMGSNVDNLFEMVKQQWS